MTRVLASLLLATMAMLPAQKVRAADAQVTGIHALHQHGQTFITWRDVAEGEQGAAYRYSVYRSEEPITAQNIARAELCYRGVLHNSAKLFGSAFASKDRLDPEKPYSVIKAGGEALAPWSGLAVVTVAKPRRSHYAVVATDLKHNPLSEVVAGESATTTALDEKPAEIQPIKLYDSRERKGPYVANTSLTGKTGLALHVTLHGSQSTGGGAGEYGDYYLYFGTPDMGYRDGLPGVFSVEEHRTKDGNRLLLRVRDAIERPAGNGALETYWFGYSCIPQGAEHAEPRFYPFTETRLLWTIAWVAGHYEVDPERITIGGNSSGAVGSMKVGFRHPELFAAVYPAVGRVRNVPAIALEGAATKAGALLMSDGKTGYFARADGPKFAASQREDLPFLGWACGRNDGYATWQEHIDMVQAMTAAHHGFAFAWNNGGHGEGGNAMRQIEKYYPASQFAKNRSYPAFGNSSIDDRMGNGDPRDGDLEGGINLGFRWRDVVDEPERWSIRIANELAKEAMTVDVTPRRCQHFKIAAGTTVQWTSSTGDSGSVLADEAGLVTVKRVRILPEADTELTLTVKAATQ